MYGIIKDRKEHPKEGSYTNYLFEKGIDKILKKIGEENTEIVIAAKNPNPEEIKYEISVSLDGIDGGKRRDMGAYYAGTFQALNKMIGRKHKIGQSRHIVK